MRDDPLKNVGSVASFGGANHGNMLSVVSEGERDIIDGEVVD